MKALLIDCDDSFTLNIADYLLTANVEVIILNHAKTSLVAIEPLDFDSIILSPGPNRPEDVPLLQAIIHKYYKTKPILGICLGHQALGAYFGYSVEPSTEPMHGISVKINCVNDSIFNQIPINDFHVMRYNSLALTSKDILTEFIPICTLANGEIMGCKHLKHPIYSFQFHPESIGTLHGFQLLLNWVKNIAISS